MDQTTKKGFSSTVVVVVSLLSAIVGGIIALAFLPSFYPQLFIASEQVRTEEQQVIVSYEYREDDSAAIMVAEEVGPAVVGVVNYRYSRNFFTGKTELVQAGVGSGVIFDEEGYIVTNHHVVENADYIEVVLADGRKLEGNLVGHDSPYTDLAVLKIEADNLHTARFGDSDEVRVGETAIAVGNPLGLEFQNSVTKGIISNITDWVPRTELDKGYVRVFTLLQTDATINHGNSGGALVNSKGEVIGINSLKITDAENMGFAIPINLVKKITSDILEYGYVKRAWLGVSLMERQEANLRFKINAEEGVMIYNVYPDSPAHQAELKSGWFITALDGIPIDDVVDLMIILENKRVGELIDVEVIVDLETDSKETLTIELGEMPVQN